jgi:hypothetical protein
MERINGKYVYPIIFLVMILYIILYTNNLNLTFNEDDADDLSYIEAFGAHGGGGHSGGHSSHGAKGGKGGGSYKNNDRCLVL